MSGGAGEEGAQPAPGALLSEMGEAAKTGDPDRFEAALFEEDLALRERFFTLIAFNLELARTRLRVTEPHIGLIRLQWWRDAIEEAEAGAPARAHPLAAPVSALIAAAPKGFAAEAIRLVDAWERDLDEAPFPSIEALRLHLESTAGRMARLGGWLALGAAPEGAADKALSGFGLADGAARALEATPALAAAGRSLLPLTGEVLARHLRGATTDEAREAAATLAGVGAAAWREGRSAARRLERARALALKPIMLSAWRAPRMLAAAQKPGCDLFRDLGAESPFRRRASLLLRGLFSRW
ncbi:MAG: squalene/phytoene synthase family protein [Pseudomonadota bacterium]